MLTYFLFTCLYLQIGTEIKNVLKMGTQKNNILDDIGWYEIFAWWKITDQNF